jgi:hypothetical protein
MANFVDFLFDAQAGNMKLFADFLKKCHEVRTNPKKTPEQDLVEWFHGLPNGYSDIDEADCKKLLDMQKNTYEGAVPDSY